MNIPEGHLLERKFLHATRLHSHVKIVVTACNLLDECLFSMVITLIGWYITSKEPFELINLSESIT